VANNSCAPNAGLENVSDHDRPVLFALSDVHASEEITHWYGWSHEQPLVCRCGARACLGTIGWKAGKADMREIERIIGVAEQNSNWVMLAALIELSPDSILPWLSAQHPALLVRTSEGVPPLARPRSRCATMLSSVCRAMSCGRSISPKAVLARARTLGNDVGRRCCTQRRALRAAGGDGHDASHLETPKRRVTDPAP
jgi:hypothetical protein